MTDKATHTPLPYECFRDASYYDMWFVRRVNEREWGKGFHLVNGDEAAALRDLLNTRADSHHRLVEALEAFVNCARYTPHMGGTSTFAGWSQGALRDAEALARAALKEAGR